MSDENTTVIRPADDSPVDSDWATKVRIAKEAREAGRAARVGKPTALETTRVPVASNKKT